MTNAQALDAVKKYSAHNGGRVEPIAAACGVSESTVRRWMERSKMPRNPLIRAALEKFVAKSGGAK